MALLRCIGQREGVRCQRRCLVVAPKGAQASDDYTCSGCASGQAPFVHKASERKGQQKQAKKK